MTKYIDKELSLSLLGELIDVINDLAQREYTIKDDEPCAYSEFKLGELKHPWVYYLPVEELPLFQRAKRCLSRKDIIYVGDLIQFTEMDLLKIPNFGRVGIGQVKSILGLINLELSSETVPFSPIVTNGISADLKAYIIKKFKKTTRGALIIND